MIMMAKHELRLAKAASWTLLGVGAVAIVASIIYVSSVLGFIGLGLVSWGAILLYIQPEEYTKRVLLDAVLMPAFASLSQIMQELDYRGKAMYLPPKYFKDPEDSRLYIPKQKDGRPPPSDSVLKQDNIVFVRGYGIEGILLTPPGAELARLLEKMLGVSFIKVDLDYLVQNLPKLFIEDLEIAEGLEIGTDRTDEKAGLVGGSQEKNCMVYLKVTNSTFEGIWKENRELSYVFGKIGCPVCSAVACALAKATGKLVSIENVRVSSDGKILEADYKVLEAIEPEEQVKPALEKAAEAVTPAFRSRRLDVVSLTVAALGAVILCLVGWLMWYDTTVWGKSILLIFFEDRSGQAVSLGIGMRVVYYFVAGIVLFLSGLIVFLRRRRHSTTPR